MRILRWNVVAFLLVLISPLGWAADVDDRTLCVWTNYLNSKFSLEGPKPTGWSKERANQNLAEDEFRRGYLQSVAAGDLQQQEEFLSKLYRINPSEPEYIRWARELKERKNLEKPKSAMKATHTNGVGRIKMPGEQVLYVWQVSQAPEGVPQSLLNLVAQWARDRKEWSAVKVQNGQALQSGGMYVTVEPVTLSQGNELSRALEDLVGGMKLPLDKTPRPSLTAVKVPGSSSEQQKIAELSRLVEKKDRNKSATEPTYSFSVKSLPVEDALALFGRLNQINIIADPEVVGTITVDFQDLSLSSALDAILKNIGCFIEIEGGIIRVRAYESRLFKVDYLALIRTMTSSSTTSTSELQNSQVPGTTSSTSSGSSGGDGTKLGATSTSDFWKSLFYQLAGLLSRETPEEKYARELRMLWQAIQDEIKIKSLNAELEKKSIRDSRADIFECVSELRKNGMSEETVNEYVRSQLAVGQSKEVLGASSGTSKVAQSKGLAAVATKILNTAGGMGDILSEATYQEVRSVTPSNNTGGGGQDKGSDLKTSKTATPSTSESSGKGDGGDESNYIVNKENGVKLQINPLAGTVFVRDRKANVEKIAEYLDLLKVRVEKQVDLNVQVFNVEFTDDRVLAIDWQQVYLRVNQAVMTASAVLNPAAGLATAFPGLASPMAFTVSGSGTKAVLQAIEEQGKVKILSQPRIRTINQQAAQIKVVRQDPFFISQSNVLQSTSGNAQGNNVEVNTVTTGTFVSITPQISENKIVTLDILPVFSTLVKTVSFVQTITDTNNVAVTTTNATAPVLDVKQASTIVRVKNTDTVVMGGFVGETATEVRKKIPVLGDIPGLGTLFTGMADAKIRSELVLFVTPTIVEDLPVASASSSAP
jgi:type II secretory pathway component GspD/PulD (secretin)